jgi:hypothetical protein
MDNRCFEKGLETKVLWGHKWNLCNVYMHKEEAEERKLELEIRMRVKARVQTIKEKYCDMIRGGKICYNTVYLVWWR